MKDILRLGLLIVAVALVGGLIFAISLIGAETVKLLATLLVAGLILAGLILASALPIRAWRKNDAAPVERQVIREVRVIDNRPAPLPQLPAPQPAPFGVFPELLRASYQAGRRAQPPGDTVEAEYRPIEDGWTGDITK